MTEKKLTPQQEHFCQLVASGKTQADAYRGAYKVNPKTKPETTQANASRLMANSKVVARVAELRKELAEKELWTREDSLRTLIDKALPLCEKPQDFVAVLKELNAMQGFNAPQKTEHTGKDGRPLIVRIIDDVPEC